MQTEKINKNIIQLKDDEFLVENPDKGILLLKIKIDELEGLLKIHKNNLKSDFLKLELSKLQTKYPQTSIICGKNEYIDDYIVQISPKSIYENDEWVNIGIKFMSKFSNQICFVPEDSSLKIKEILFTL